VTRVGLSARFATNVTVLMGALVASHMITSFFFDNFGLARGAPKHMTILWPDLFSEGNLTRGIIAMPVLSALETNFCVANGTR
jgi:hypothetical protein